MGRLCLTGRSSNYLDGYDFVGRVVSCLEVIPADYALFLFYRKANLAGGAENRPLRLCSGRRVWGQNQGKLRTNQPQLTPAQSCERKRKFRVPRFVS